MSQNSQTIVTQNIFKMGVIGDLQNFWYVMVMAECGQEAL